jgi:DNA-directed RNA polymerase specialized sigma24 family protein
MAQTSKSRPKQDWIPTEAVFRKFLAWLDEGYDSNGSRYLEMRERLVRYFDRKNCIPSDDLADETLNRVARRLEEEGAITEASPPQYCYIVAKFVFLEHLRENHQQGTSDADVNLVAAAATGPSTPEPVISEQKRHDCLDSCLEKLAAADRDLILEYYRGEQREKIQHRRELAEKAGLSTNALSIRACRIRDKLESCLKRCCEA